MTDNLPQKVRQSMENLAQCLKLMPTLSDQIISQFSIMERSFYVLDRLKFRYHPPQNNNQLATNNLPRSENPQKNVRDQCLNKKRGRYTSYTREFKQQVIRLYKEENYNFNRIAKMKNIAVKNVSRWCKFGIERAEGAGRDPLDTIMEEKLIEWISISQNQGVLVRKKQIRNQALALSAIPQFKASPGWLNNFLKRYNIELEPQKSKINTDKI